MSALTCSEFWKLSARNTTVQLLTLYTGPEPQCTALETDRRTTL